MTAADSALELVAEERRRQVESLGYDWVHDDQHDRGELVQAAICYAANEPVYKKVEQASGSILFSDLWPWPLGRPTRVRNGPAAQIKSLTKAAALLIAEIERLQRVQKADG